jgi:membrane protein DedA with SNARE-associated domain
VVRSFISIPAGVLGTPLASYAVLTLAGSLIWCLGFAGVGWALGGSWTSFHHSFRYADYAALASCWLGRKRLRATAGDRGGRLRQTRLRR